MPRRRRILGTAFLALYSAALTSVLALTAPWWARELRPGGKYREGWRERLGLVPRTRLEASTSGQAVVWVHAVSVGEVLAAAPLIVKLRAARPHIRVVVSTTTRTGQAIARSRFGAESVFYFPADFAFAVRAWLRFLRPALVVLIESEFWPRMLFECAQAGVPVAVVNARVSPRSWPRYRRLRALWRPLLATLALVHAQTPADAERLRFLGAQRVEAAGNLKYDVELRPPTPLLSAIEAALPSGGPAIFVCGSTLAGEEELLLDALPPEAILVLAPRHPERFEEVASLLAQGPRPFARLSVWQRNPAPFAPGSVLLLDSVGELAVLYRLATLAIVGGGFLHQGGHNPLESAALGKPTVIGPGYANFLDVVATMRGAEAVVVAVPAALGATVLRLLAAPGEAAALGARAQAVCERNTGATAHALAALLALVRG